MKDENTRQEIARQYVRANVHANVTSELEALLEAGYFTFDEIENLIVYIVDGEEYTAEELENLDLDEEPDQEIREIYEWWLVDPFMYASLSATGETVLQIGQNHYWGRCTTGQAIYLDYAIYRILEIKGKI